MNSRAKQLFSIIAPLFGLSDANEIIGLNMNHFHKRPQHQNKIMETMSEGHRARITIKDQFVGDIVITPIKNEESVIEGYVVMLMDVTTKAEEERKKEHLIHALSIPMIRIWKKTIALPLIGEFDLDRGDRLISSVLQECASDANQSADPETNRLSEADRHRMHHCWNYAKSGPINCST
ncbi:hypothetical protein [Peribacillus deserti]|uniref:hypothetical protein n=1 Tax=Peribacillus deserti TaxID=673318 RepID=UPI0021528D24|nr:hypothetical protein [Peribacillus deserti]